MEDAVSAVAYRGTTPATLRALEGTEGLRTGASDRLAMAHDASHYLLTPDAVVDASSDRHVAAIMRACGNAGISLTFRSGGTSLSGQASTSGVLVDTRSQFRRIEVAPDGMSVRVQPGVTVRQVNARLAAYGRKLGPDPASEAACTIGGVIANNSSGMACGTAFNTYRTLRSMTFVLPSGTTIDSSRSSANSELRAQEPELFEGLLQIRDELRSDAAAVETIGKQFSMKNTMGYGVNSFLDHDDPVEILTHLIIGGEGTLAFVAEAVFATIPVGSHASTGLLVFDTLQFATEALPALVSTDPTAIELLDATSLIVSKKDPAAGHYLAGIDVDRHAALLVEYQASSAEELRELTEPSAGLLASLPLSSPAHMSSEAATRSGLWHLRKGLYATVAGNRPTGTTALLEDVAVPVPQLAETCRDLHELFRLHDYTDSVIFGHAKDGNIHFLLNERFDDAERLRHYVDFTEELVDLVLGAGGTLKAEHGTGRIMAPYVERQFGPVIYRAMVRVKQLCDPRATLNPGIIITDDPMTHVKNLKSTPSIEAEADRCVECGYCEPVCPSKDLTLTPRQRIVLRRELARAKAQGDSALVAELERSYEYDGLETCAADGMCQTACPVLIDTGALVKRLRAESSGKVVNTAWSQAAKHWSGTTRLAAGALTAADRVHPSIPSTMSRGARSVLGDDAIPLWDVSLPAGGSPRRAVDATSPEAVFMPSCLGAMFAPAEDNGGVASAFLELCQRAGVSVRTPEGINELCCGTPWKSKGLTDGYHAMVKKDAAVLWEATDHGRLPVVSDSVSCTEGLDRLFDDVATTYGQQLTVVDAIAFVDTHIRPRLDVKSRISSLALHPTCSSTRLGLNDSLNRIAEALADSVFVPFEWSCCAFAGDRGMLHPELTRSATAPQAEAIRSREFDAYASANRTCEIGMSRATGQTYVHLLELYEHATRPKDTP